MMLRLLHRVLLFGGLVLLLASCAAAPVPLNDYTIARAALEAAKAVDAGRYSPGYFHKAENSLQKAKALYEDRDYAEAREEFRHAREYAERAENSARLIRFKNGEVL